MTSTPTISDKTKRTPARASFADVLNAYLKAGLPIERVAYDRRNDVIFVTPENTPYNPDQKESENGWKAHGRGL